LRDARIIARVLENQWALHAPFAEAFCEVLNRHMAGVKLGERELEDIRELGRMRVEQMDRERKFVAGGFGSSPAPQSDPYTMMGSVAVVPVEGMLSKYADMINGVSQPSGMTSSEISSAIEQAASDRRTKSVLLDVDSPGGTVAGIDDICETIARVQAAGMPVIGYAHDLGASGAYAVLAACDAVYANPLATVGSIGVMRIVEDTSKLTEARGVKRMVIASGPHKGVGVSGVAISEAHLEQMRSDVNATARQFIGSVSTNRGWTEAQTTRNTTGAVFNAVDAVDLGLVDKVVGFRELVDAMNNNSKPSTIGR
jgi:capsid assembly protease